MGGVLDRRHLVVHRHKLPIDRLLGGAGVGRFGVRIARVSAEISRDILVGVIRPGLLRKIAIVRVKRVEDRIAAVPDLSGTRQSSAAPAVT